MRMTVQIATDVGTQRNHNEDGVMQWPEHKAVCVYDGMAGHSGFGSVSHLLEDALTQTVASPDSLAQILETVNLKFHEALGATTFKGAGATICLVRFERDDLCFAHAGDTRLYIHRDGLLKQLTRDHSLLNDYLDSGHVLTPEEIEAFPHKNVITRAIGIKPELEVQAQRIAMRPGDRYLMCSDGIHDMLSDAELEALFADDDIAREDLVDRLILEANMAGGKDNIAVAMIWAE